MAQLNIERTLKVKEIQELPQEPCRQLTQDPLFNYLLEDYIKYMELLLTNSNSHTKKQNQM
jgi:hypothetical protein